MRAVADGRQNQPCCAARPRLYAALPKLQTLDGRDVYILDPVYVDLHG